MGCWWFRTGRHGPATRGACYPFLYAILYDVTLLSGVPWSGVTREDQPRRSRG
jgi:hypothetical protein